MKKNAVDIKIDFERNMNSFQKLTQPLTVVPCIYMYM